LVVLGALEAAESGLPPESIHWRFEQGAEGQSVQIASDEGGKCEAVAADQAPVVSSEVPSAFSRSSAVPITSRCALPVVI